MPTTWPESRRIATPALRRIRDFVCNAESHCARHQARKRLSSVLLIVVSNGGTRTRNKWCAKQCTPSSALVAESHSQLTAIPAASIAVTTAMSWRASKDANRMTEKQFQAEKQYQVALMMAKTLHEKGLLTREEYATIDAILLDKFQPYLGALLSDNALT